MAPEWFALDAIPFDRMWADDKIWMPMLLEGGCMRARSELMAGKQFTGYFKFRKSELLSYVLEEGRKSREELNYKE
eukprot:m.34239 g.34239  ORF g.34239 m.34239 type:complete len:76 (+) comp5193_c0_seq2:48-275(+)